MTAGFVQRVQAMTLRLLLVLTVSVPAAAQTPAPIADIHTHYKWSQAEVTSPQQAIQVLRDQNVELAVVIGTPAEFALKLQVLDPERIIPVYGPYNDLRNWFRWSEDMSLVAEARQALESGLYHGIGELHLIGGFMPATRNNRVLNELMKLGAEFQKPVLLHSEYSRPDPFLELCHAHPNTPVLWAHAGTRLEPPAVRQVLRECPAVSVELSARDPWRYVNDPIADPETGRLLPAWEKLVLDYPQRFLVGSDPVWPVDRLDNWDQADTGWNELPRFLDFHRAWTSHLPVRVQNQVRLENARRLFAHDGSE